MQCRFKLPVLCVCLGVVGLGLPIAQGQTGQAGSRAGAGPVTATGASATVRGRQPRPPMPQELYSGAWRTDGGYVSIAQIKNLLKTSSLSVTATLFMVDGTPYQLPAFLVAPEANLDININDYLNTAPSSIAGHLSQWGSMRLVYNWPASGSLVATMDVENGPSLQHLQPFRSGQVAPPDPVVLPAASANQSSGSQSSAAQAAVTADQKQTQARIAETESGPRSFHAYWWRSDPSVVGWFTVANTTENPITVAYTVSGDAGAALASVSEALPPHGFEFVDLSQLVADLPPAQQQSGSIRVDYQGLRNAIAVSGGLESAQGPSATDLKFAPVVSPSEPKVQIEVGATGLRLGGAPTAFGLASGATLLPYLKLRNTTSQSIAVMVTVDAQTSSAGADAPPRSLQLSPVVLTALATTDVDLAQQLAGTVDGDATLSVGVTFTGSLSDVEVLAGSMDTETKRIMPAETRFVGPDLKVMLPYWTTRNGGNSLLSVWNPTSNAQSLVLTLNSADGLSHYGIPLILQAHAMREINLADIEGSGVLDPAGNSFPQEGWGGAALASADIPTANAQGIIVMPKGGAPMIRVLVDATMAYGTAQAVATDDAPQQKGRRNGQYEFRTGSASQSLHADFWSYGCGYMYPELDLSSYEVTLIGSTNATFGTWDCQGGYYDITADAFFLAYDITGCDIASMGGDSVGIISPGVSEIWGEAEEWWQMDTDWSNPPYGDLEFTWENSDSYLDVAPSVYISGGGSPVDLWWFGSSSNTPSGYMSYQETMYTDTYFCGSNTWGLDDNGASVSHSDPSATTYTLTVNGGNLSGGVGDTCPYVVVNGESSGDYCISVRAPTAVAETQWPACTSYYGGYWCVNFDQLNDNLGSPLPTTVRAAEHWTTGANYPNLTFGAGCASPATGCTNWTQFGTMNDLDEYGTIIHDYNRWSAGGWWPSPGLSNTAPSCGTVVINWHQVFYIGGPTGGSETAGFLVQHYTDAGDNTAAYFVMNYGTLCEYSAGSG